MVDEDARASESAGGSAGGSTARGGQGVDQVSRQLGMTLDEAANILNVKKPSEAFKEGSSELQQMLKVKTCSFESLSGSSDVSTTDSMIAGV